jgi:ABC-type transporter Mla subunit MlaD
VVIVVAFFVATSARISAGGRWSPSYQVTATVFSAVNFVPGKT